MIYRLYITDPELYTEANAATTVDQHPGWSFIFVPEQPLYQQFKQDVLDGAELQYLDGVPMTQEDATAFIETLP